MPPLWYRLRLSLVKELFQRNETVSPDQELVDVPVVGLEPSAADSSIVYVVQSLNSCEPLLGIFVGGRQKKGQSQKRFIYDWFGQ